MRHPAFLPLSLVSLTFSSLRQSRSHNLLFLRRSTAIAASEKFFSQFIHYPPSINGGPGVNLIVGKISDITDAMVHNVSIDLLVTYIVIHGGLCMACIVKNSNKALIGSPYAIRSTRHRDVNGYVGCKNCMYLFRCVSSR